MVPRIFSTPLPAVLLSSAVLAQGDCDSLSIASIHYSAFDPSIVEVRTLNSGGWGFSYPWLVLFDGNGDTLARDYDTFFVIGPDQTFQLVLEPGANIPVGPFPATLHVWANNALACTFELPADLCPPGPCAEVFPFVIDQSGGSSGHECSWTVADTSGTTVASGTLVIPVGSTQVRDTVCLAPGAYLLSMTEVSGTGEDLQFWMEGSLWWSSVTSPHVFLDSNMVSPVLMYEACFDGPNMVPEFTGVEFEFTVTNGILRAGWSDGSPIQRLEVVDATGRLLHVASGGGNSLELDIADLSSGILVVQATDGRKRYGRRTIAWVP